MGYEERARRSALAEFEKTYSERVIAGLPLLERGERASGRRYKFPQEMLCGRATNVDGSVPLSFSAHVPNEVEGRLQANAERLDLSLHDLTYEAAVLGQAAQNEESI